MGNSVFLLLTYHTNFKMTTEIDMRWPWNIMKIFVQYSEKNMYGVTALTTASRQSPLKGADFPFNACNLEKTRRLKYFGPSTPATLLLQPCQRLTNPAHYLASSECCQ